MWTRGKFFVVTALFQILFLILFAIFAEYDKSAHPKASSAESDDAMKKNISMYPSKCIIHSYL